MTILQRIILDHHIDKLDSIKPKTISMWGYLSKIPGAERRGIVIHELVALYWPVNLERHMNITMEFQYDFVLVQPLWPLTRDIGSNQLQRQFLFTFMRECSSGKPGCLAEIIGFASPLLQQHISPPCFIPFYTSVSLLLFNTFIEHLTRGISLYQ